MSDAFKTSCFVGAAIVLAAAAGISHWMNLPSNSEEFELVGQPFFEEFNSAELAKSLEVVGFNKESTELQRFNIEESDGLWTIPSHYNYPAEAVDRLAKTATSVMGVQREALVGRLESEHERLGVLDPLDEDLDDPENAGQRITMKDEAGDVVLDLIIGKEVEDAPIEEDMRDFENMTADSLKSYYVRRPDEQQTYQVRLDIDLSTKFSDWIDPDLLQVNRNRLTKISIDNYTLEESPTGAGQSTLMKSQGDRLSFNKADSGWKLDGLDEKTETLETPKIEQLLGVLEAMKISGVRPKYKYKDHLLLTPDLKLNDRPEFKENPNEVGLAIREMQADLSEKGFNLASVEGQMGLVSIDGDIKVGTDEGVLYTLHVGAPVDGSDEEIEVGGANNKSQDEDDKVEKTADDEASDEATENEATDESDEEALNRYLMIRVAFEESLVADKPTMPVEPVKPMMPEGYSPAGGEPVAKESAEVEPPDDVEAPPSEGGGCGGQETEQEQEAEEAPPTENEGEPTTEGESAEAQEKQEPETAGTVRKSEAVGEVEQEKQLPEGIANQNDDKTDEQEKETRNPDFVAYETALKAYEAKLDEFNLAKVKYEEDLKKFQKRVELGKKRVAMLNERFGDWFYVISANNLKLLQMNRDDVVKVKQPGEGGPILQGQPPISMPNIPGLNFPNPRQAPATQPPTENVEGPDGSPGMKPNEESGENAKVPDEKADKPVQEPGEKVGDQQNEENQSGDDKPAEKSPDGEDEKAGGVKKTKVESQPSEKQTPAKDPKATEEGSDGQG